MNKHEIRAIHDEQVLTVYQAYSPEIAQPALRAGKFVSPFSFSRMTWIKPSFNWMMYRSGYASKPGQEVIVSIAIKRSGFEWALRNAVLASFNPEIHDSYEEWQTQLTLLPVRVQWDPARDWKLDQMGVRAIQIGLSGAAVQSYVDDWIVSINDVTSIAKAFAEAQLKGVEPDRSLRLDLQETVLALNPETYKNVAVD